MIHGPHFPCNPWKSDFPWNSGKIGQMSMIKFQKYPWNLKKWSIVSPKTAKNLKFSPAVCRQLKFIMQKSTKNFGLAPLAQALGLKVSLKLKKGNYWSKNSKFLPAAGKLIRFI